MIEERTVNWMMSAWGVVMLSATLTVYRQWTLAALSNFDARGFDVAAPRAQVPPTRDAPRSAVAPAPLPDATGRPEAPPPGSLAMLRGSLEEPVSASSPNGGPSPDKARGAANRVAGKYEAGYRKLLDRYQAKYPKIDRAVTEWQGHPELRRLDERYRADHDFVAFARGIVKSRNHWGIVTKYGASPEFRELGLEALGRMPSEMSSALNVALESEQKRDAVAATLASALGLPPALFAGSKTGGPALAAVTLAKDAEALAKKGLKVFGERALSSPGYTGGEGRHDHDGH